MILDLHVHSVFSIDSPVRPEEYAQKLDAMRAEYAIDGFVLMEHNHMIAPEECDLDKIGREYGLVILAGVEADTYWGHLLVYGMTPGIWSRYRDARKQDPMAFAAELSEERVALVPAHPFRGGFIGMGERCRELPGVLAVEGINGSDSHEENASAMALAERAGFFTVGGSDAHFLAETGKGLTRFEREVRSMDEVVSEIKSGRCCALTLDQARRT